MCLRNVYILRRIYVRLVKEKMYSDLSKKQQIAYKAWIHEFRAWVKTTYKPVSRVVNE
ncbi:unnamed protein product [marine sediment metagenome]|uniref:Uncharacterized protein n=1 Tax=marine sediment metagenome TaxID=412755 RepID=X0Z3H2_9ZZZZ